jgi:hypothetical protein
MNEEMTPPEAPRRGRKPSEVVKRTKLNNLIDKIREKKSKIDKTQKKY